MKRPVIVALDVDSQQQLKQILAKLGDPEKTTIKIGMELFYNFGGSLVKKLSDQGYDIFLDLKMHDIPNTVYNGAKQVAKLGINYTTVHALGGSEMIQAAKAGLIAGTPKNKDVPKLLAVTELTSISDKILKEEQNCVLSMKNQVISLAKTAKNSGADGIICSPLEVSSIKKKIGDDFLYITPGIRPENIQSGDQKRIATPKMAKDAGASAIVVGRPITLANNPKKAYDEIKKEFN